MILLIDKFPELDKKLIDLLESLEPEEWHKQTVAKLWTVKDVAAHLLDGNIRNLSMLRDGYMGLKPENNSYQELLDFLNGLNAEWVQAMKRVSPALLIDLLKHTGKPFNDYCASLDPHAKAQFSVAWAGEEESSNWMHLAREYTEKFLHQQQIRDATGRQGLMNDEYYLPFLEVCMYALAHTLRDTPMEKGCVLKMKIVGEVSGEWLVQYNGEKWQRIESNAALPIETEVRIDSYAAWKLFSKSRRAKNLSDQIEISGNKALGEKALEMVSFMA